MADQPSRDLATNRQRRIGAVRLAAFGLAIAIFGTCGAVVFLGGRDAAVPILGRIAPDIQGETFTDGHVDLSQLRGRWVLVNFFAPWCTACAVEHPELERFAQSHAVAGDAQLVSVAIETSRSEIKRFMAEYSPRWPVVLDLSGGTAVSYGQLKLPESYLVAPDGTVAAKFTGAVTAKAVDRLMQSAR